MVGRRGLLAGAAAALVGGAAWRARREPALAFEPHPAVPGFRRLVTAGEVSSGSAGRWDGLIGIAAPSGPDRGRGAAREAVRRDLCAALFGEMAGEVPVASFSDYDCPYCRVTTERLAALASEPGSPVRVAWHELAAFGRGLGRRRPRGSGRLAPGRLSRDARPPDALALPSHLGLSRGGGRRGGPRRRPPPRRHGLARDRGGAGGGAPRWPTSSAFPARPRWSWAERWCAARSAERTLRRLVARERADGPAPGLRGVIPPRAGASFRP